MRAYHRVDPLMDERKGHYSPAQFGAFLKIQLLAGRQTRRGWFRSVAALKGMLPGSYLKHLAFLIAEGDLIEQEGQLYVDGWEEWQEGDLTVGDRMARLRNRRRNATVTSTVTPAVTQPSPTAIGVGISSSVGVSGSNEPSNARERPDGRADLEAFLVITRRAPTPRQRRLLDDVLDRHDLTGPAWAADVMYRHPDDPIGAVIEADKAWRQERIAAAQAAESPKPIPRRSSGLPTSTRELMDEMAAQMKEPA